VNARLFRSIQLISQSRREMELDATIFLQQLHLNFIHPHHVLRQILVASARRRQVQVATASKI